jgi:Flp pilus assembly protein TadB
MDSVNVKKIDSAKRLALITGCVCAAALIAFTLIMGMSASIFLIPVLCSVPALAFFLAKGKPAGPKAELMMNESPTVIGMLRLMIDGGRSLDHAVREIARNGPKNISALFRKAVWDVDTRSSTDIRESLNRMLSSLPERVSAFRRSMYLIVSASDSKDEHERTRMTKDANDTILDGLKEMGESYSSKLNAPCMVIFGLGVMIPMILVSILPMLSVGGQFTSATLDTTVIAIITLLVIPAVVAFVIIMVVSKNPFYIRSDEKMGWSPLISAAVCVSSFAAMFAYTEDIGTSMSVSAILSGMVLFAILHPRMSAERKRMKTERTMADALFDIGNRLLSGENLEKAMISSFRERKDVGTLAVTLERCILLSRGDTAKAIHNAMDAHSKRMAGMYCDIYAASLKDLRDAGRLAISMGHQLQDQEATVNGIKNKLRSMLDMMTGTSSVFAPLVLGISISMLAPLANIAGGSDMSFTTPVLNAYLIQLAALISVLTTQLKCRGGILTTLYTFSTMMPVALIVFMITSGIPV